MPVDVLGVVTHCGQLGTIKRKADNSELPRRDVTIADSRCAGRAACCSISDRFSYPPSSPLKQGRCLAPNQTARQQTAQTPVCTTLAGHVISKVMIQSMTGCRKQIAIVCTRRGREKLWRI
jgi:hypothetical protein